MLRSLFRSLLCSVWLSFFPSFFVAIFRQFIRSLFCFFLPSGVIALRGCFLLFVIYCVFLHVLVASRLI